MSGDWQGLLRMFENHQGLFYTEVMLHIETMRGYDVNFGIIPSPKYDEQQENCRKLIIYKLEPDTDMSSDVIITEALAGLFIV